MRSAIRLGVIVAVTLASSAAWTGARADEDPSGPAQGIFEPGAASAEPAQAIEEDPGTKGHRDWVESIWSSP
jgi:hypothetical protein